MHTYSKILESPKSSRLPQVGYMQRDGLRIKKAGNLFRFALSFPFCLFNQYQ